MKLKDLISNFNNPLLEGLIKSHSTDTAVHHLYMWTFINYGKATIHDNQGNKILVKVTETIDNNEINSFLKMTNNMGYFISSCQPDIHQRKYIKYTDGLLSTLKPPYNIILEAKYDKIVNVPNILYHITHTNKVDKILKLGLTPKSNSKLSHHPERIYFVTDKSNLVSLTDHFKKLYPNDEFTTLAIQKPTRISNNDSGLVFFQDPNFMEKGVYTYQNIPPQYINVL